MSNKYWILIAFLFIGFLHPLRAAGELDQEGRLEYCRAVLSDRKVMDVYGKKLNMGYRWAGESAVIGKEDPNHKCLGQIQILMEKNEKVSGGKFIFKKQRLSISFLWNEAIRQIEKVDEVEIIPN